MDLFIREKVQKQERNGGKKMNLEADEGRRNGGGACGVVQEEKGGDS